MKREVIFNFIQNIELFNGFDEEELNVLVDALKEKTYQKGELLFEENGPRKDIFIIYKGEVELFKTPSFGSETKLSYFKSGDFLGEGS